MKWKNEVDFVDLWTKYGGNAISLEEMAFEVEKRLLAIIDSYESKSMRDELSEIAHDFGTFALSDDQDEGGFDDILQRLYDFGDRGKALLIKTFGWQK